MKKLAIFSLSILIALTFMLTSCDMLPFMSGNDTTAPSIIIDQNVYTSFNFFETTFLNAERQTEIISTKTDSTTPQASVSAQRSAPLIPRSVEKRGEFDFILKSSSLFCFICFYPHFPLFEELTEIRHSRFTFQKRNENICDKHSEDSTIGDITKYTEYCCEE